MKNTRQFKTIQIIILFATIISSLPGCTFAKRSIAVLRSTDHFIPHNRDSRVLYEVGAEKYANIIVSQLPEAIKEVENKQYRQFVKPAKVYICSSTESFTKFAGVDVPAIVVIKLFLAPRLFAEHNEVIDKYLIHELSHLHIRDQVGNFKMSRLPFWFKEGLAVYISGGGGAHTVTEREAVEFINEGKHFIPNETGGFIFQNNHNDWGLTSQMFYLQSKMFIEYLAERDANAFKQFLLSTQNGDKLYVALENSYKQNLQSLWEGFIRESQKG